MIFTNEEGKPGLLGHNKEQAVQLFATYPYLLRMAEGLTRVRDI